MRNRWGKTGRASVAALMIAIVALAACGGPSSDAPGDGGAPSDERLKIFLIGVDGLTWRILDPMLERGEMPHLASLVDRGARAEFITVKPALSPIVWTTIATGKFANQHGIRNFWRDRTEEERGGEQAEDAMIDRLAAIGYIDQAEHEEKIGKTLYRSTDWKARPLWQILGDRGLESTVLGWWVTYPVWPVNGVMVSDRYTSSRFELEAEETGKPYDNSEGNVHPRELEPRMRESLVDVKKVDAAWLERFIEGPIEVDDEMTLHNRIDELRIVLARDASYHRMALDLLSGQIPDFFTVYYEGVDISCHYFWKYLFPEEWNEMFPDSPVDPGELARFRNVIEEHYRLMDEYIGDILEFADDRTLVMVMSDHGFVTGRRSEDAGLAYETVSGTHGKAAPPGVLVMAGHGARLRYTIPRATVLDITPTTLAAFGLPVARDMKGRVLADALEPQTFGHPLPPSYIPTYESERPDALP